MVADSVYLPKRYQGDANIARLAVDKGQVASMPALQKGGDYMKFHLTHTRMWDKAEREIFSQFLDKIQHSPFREKRSANNVIELDSLEELKDLSKLLGFDLRVNVSSSNSWLLEIWDSYQDIEELQKRGIKI